MDRANSRIDFTDQIRQKQVQMPQSKVQVVAKSPVRRRLNRGIHYQLPINYRYKFFRLRLFRLGTR